MFTGIVEETGSVESILRTASGIRLTVRAAKCGEGVKLGDSIAVNGCCLTVVSRKAKGKQALLDFDLLEETWKKTNLSGTSKGAAVNLERALEVGARLGGHFVSGHIDGTGTIRQWKPQGQDRVLDINAPPEILRYIVYKGSIAVDGISLTVAEVLRGGFRLWIIPHTYEATALRERSKGDRVNLEADLVAKYIEKLAKPASRRR